QRVEMESRPHPTSTKDYLARIRYAGKIEPTLGVLAALQEAHLLAVPFENLDIHAGTPILIDLPSLYRKIVATKRGGFCYELNGLFHWLLVELGFNNKLLSGRVYDRSTGEYGPEFDHMLSLTEIDGQRWLVDVGFGDFATRPLEFVVDQPLMDPNGEFLIERRDEESYRVSRFLLQDNRYVPEYCFSLKERCLEDFAGMCLYHQTSPKSHFTRKTICSIATHDGRITLSDNRLIVTEHRTRSETVVSEWLEYSAALARYFGIIWTDSPLRFPALSSRF
ncbi:MAG: arylamine N-acetyltransferase, partial [Bacteroidetes bacterium]|nr:arylamine N-acetyltransferase [Bacteroidota bacterium]